MIDTEAIYAIADAHLTLHLLAPGEADIAPAGADEGAGDAAAGELAAADGASADAPAEQDSKDMEVANQSAVAGAMRVLPENLIEDFLDEAAGMFDDIAESYMGHSGWERALVFGFVDGALAVADDSWSTFEDSYYEDAHTPDEHDADYVEIDAGIDEAAGDFEGVRPWDEAAKGYIRAMVARSEGGIASSEPALWVACAHAFMYGADAAYDMEWKFVLTPAGNVMLTDEDAISEAALAQLEMESGKGSLLDRVFDMIGIDLGELAEALGADDDEDEEGEEDDKPVEAELIEVEDADAGDAR